MNDAERVTGSAEHSKEASKLDTSNRPTALGSEMTREITRLKIWTVCVFSGVAIVALIISRLIN